jgi:predicted histidine transporter YuiF (NhaC family)
MFKQIDLCADVIVYTMEEYLHNNKTEAMLQIMLSTMSIFLSDKDMIDMIKNKVIPKLSENAHKDYFEFISKYLNDLEDENF